MYTRTIATAAVPVVGQGTWQMERERTAAIRALRAGLDAGLTHIDTAEMYGGGQVEKLVGEALAGRRDEVYLVSKVLPHNASYDGTIAACEASLRRLGTDRLDAYLLHWPGRHPLQQTLAAFERLKADGKIRAYGLSNFDIGELRHALALAGDGRIACNQVCYHVAARNIEHELLPLCAAHGVAVVAYSPLGSGSFPARGEPGGEALHAIAAAHDATPQQVALAFLLRHPGVLLIPKASRLDHVRDNAGAAELALEPAEFERLARELPAGGRDLPII